MMSRWEELGICKVPNSWAADAGGEEEEGLKGSQATSRRAWGDSGHLQESSTGEGCRRTRHDPGRVISLL